MDMNAEALAQGFLWGETKGPCAHGRIPSRCTECAKQTHIDQLEAANALLRKECAIHKERGEFWHGMAAWAYQRTSAALMIPSNKPREARADRDQAVCDINKKIGGVLR